jgi:hypothetical protein
MSVFAIQTFENITFDWNRFSVHALKTRLGCTSAAQHRPGTFRIVIVNLNQAGHTAATVVPPHMDNQPEPV